MSRFLETIFIAVVAMIVVLAPGTVLGHFLEDENGSFSMGDNVILVSVTVVWAALIVGLVIRDRRRS